jgi:hypothetical protein
MHHHVDADMPAFLDRRGGADPREIDEGIAHDLLAPDRGVGEHLAPDDLDEHRAHQHHVERQKQPSLGVLSMAL